MWQIIGILAEWDRSLIQERTTLGAVVGGNPLFQGFVAEKFLLLDVQAAQVSLEVFGCFIIRLRLFQQPVRAGLIRTNAI